VELKANKSFLYRDDLKLIDSSEEGLGNEIRIVKTISSDIKMEFGMEKYARVSLKSSTLRRKLHI
jgi:hypothetical protein